VFENIGQLAGALSYIHAKVGLNLTSLELRLADYRDGLLDLYQQINNTDMGALFEKSRLNAAKPSSY
jgi:hypothetical protein